MAIGLSFILLFANAPNQSEEAFELSTQSLKVLITASERVEHYEFNHPHKYSYRKGMREYRGTQAKEAIFTLLDTLDLSERSSIDHLVQRLDARKRESLERLEIRWLTTDNGFYTWVWTYDEAG